jgi:hypothetical protein
VAPPVALAPKPKCPDFAKVDELTAFDFAKEYGLSSERGDTLRAASLASVELASLNDKLDAELGILCAQLARDLGDQGDWRSGSDACDAAQKAVLRTRATLGDKAIAQLRISPPLCSVDASALTKCASLCDSSAPASRVKVGCEGTAGRCEGNCGGLCESAVAAACPGECYGTCDGTMTGRCSGRCRGTCDGRRAPPSGTCGGVCVGTCDKSSGFMQGECRGSCDGMCRLHAPSSCNGVCQGTCSVEWSDANCTNAQRAPSVSPACQTRCQLALSAQTSCATPHLGYVLAGVAMRDRDAAERLRAAVGKSLPALQKLLWEVGEQGPARIEQTSRMLNDVQKTFAVKSNRYLAACFEEPLRAGASDAALLLKSIERAALVQHNLTK